MRDLVAIIDRMKEALDVKTDIELARALGIKGNGVVSTWKHRNRIPYKECDVISQKTGVSFEWLLSGEGAKFTIMPKDEHSAVDKIKINSAIGYTLGLESSKQGIVTRVIMENHDLVVMMKALQSHYNADREYVGAIESLINQLENNPTVEFEFPVDFGSNKISFRNEYK